MLKLRIITALILLPIVVALVLLAPTWLLATVTGLVVLAGGWEWSILSGAEHMLAQSGYVLAMAVLIYIFWLFREDNAFVFFVNIAALVWWLFAILWVFFWRWKLNLAVKLSCGLLTLLPAWQAFVGLHSIHRGTVTVLFLLGLIWAADIGAYMAGRILGRHKLVPAVSPGKSWEGVVGGTVASVIVALLGVWLVFPHSGYMFVLICLLTGWLSVIGDLTESLFKRQAGVKDSGWLFPGHGGVLDRVDSLTAALPAFWLGLMLQGWLK